MANGLTVQALTGYFLCWFEVYNEHLLKWFGFLSTNIENKVCSWWLKQVAKLHLTVVFLGLWQ